MLRILFSADDFAATRVVPEPAPLLETKLAALALRTGIGTSWGPRWRHHALAAFPAVAKPVCAVAAGFRGAVSPTTLGSFDEAMDTAATLSRRQAVQEVRLWYGNRPEAVPRLIRATVDGDREAALVFLNAMRAAFSAVVQPYWQDIWANHQNTLAEHGRLLACRGPAATLTAVLPGARWSENCLLIDSPHERTVRPAGRGVLLTPTTFWTGPPIIGELPDQPVMLAYPARAAASLRIGPESDTLAAVLGTTRAAVLRRLTAEHTTTDLAKQLGLSTASASEHTTALRAARLISSRRDGKTVVHHATALGLDLVRANTPVTEPGSTAVAGLRERYATTPTSGRDSENRCRS
ncbi:ArsR/SmtB family transcription factor [Nocardia veterana]|uniref:ArsR/SmtB family transcription factor n=1 Tax=Nocardia veterana TaxID=132249 RepID=UPI0003068E3E|nr:ArsR family transcriptional regulator [Nocardia veterana]